MGNYSLSLKPLTANSYRLIITGASASAELFFSFNVLAGVFIPTTDRDVLILRGEDRDYRTTDKHIPLWIEALAKELTDKSPTTQRAVAKDRLEVEAKKIMKIYAEN